MSATIPSPAGRTATVEEALAFIRECRARYVGRVGSRSRQTRDRHDAVIRLLESLLERGIR